VGLLNWLGLVDAPPVPPTAVSSPWADQSSLLPAIVAEAFGIEADLPVTAADADRIPAVQRVKSFLTAVVAPLPLRVLDGSGEVASQPTWVYRSNTVVSPFSRMAATLIDGFYFGDSLWAVERGAAGQVTDAAWVPRNRWSISNEGRILVDDKPVGDREVIYFDWPGWTGLVRAGARTVRGAAAVEAAWVARARNPIALTTLRQTEGAQYTQEQINTLIQRWIKSRRDPETGSVAFVPLGLTVDTHGDADAEMFEGARNSIRLDIANYAALPASLLDGSQAEASLTYVTTEGQRSRLLTEFIPHWAAPIEQRLSQDDVVPRGQRVRFDLSELITTPPTDTGAPVED
jgi:hypothetical protein